MALTAQQILDAIQAATSVALAVSSIVRDTKVVFASDDEAAIQKALENLQHSNDALYTQTKAALEAAAQR